MSNFFSAARGQAYLPRLQAGAPWRPENEFRARLSDRSYTLASVSLDI